MAGKFIRSFRWLIGYQIARPLMGFFIGMWVASVPWRWGGNHDMMLSEREKAPHHTPTRALQIFEVSGGAGHRHLDACRASCSLLVT